jgi:hypothetical protein
MTIRLAVFLAAVAQPAIVSAQNVSYPPVAWQIASAVSPLPENLRAGAKVLGYNADGKLVTLRQGTNAMICLADNPAGKQFHVACYHRSLDPFMARGREMHALKKSNEAIDSVRGRDIKLGRYSIPQKSALYQYFAPRDSVNMQTGVIDGAQYLYVVYVPYSSYQTTGISEVPVEGGPWVMYPGKPWAHLMIQPPKTSRIVVKTP